MARVITSAWIFLILYLLIRKNCSEQFRGSGEVTANALSRYAGTLLDQKGTTAKVGLVLIRVAAAARLAIGVEPALVTIATASNSPDTEVSSWLIR